VRRFVQLVGKNGPDGVHSVMARQPLVREPSHGSNDGFKTFGNLVLHDGVEGGMRLDARQLDAQGPVLRFGKVDAFLFIERQPLHRVRRDFWIVVVHGIPSAG
jgi:hypothetical protein